MGTDAGAAQEFRTINRGSITVVVPGPRRVPAMRWASRSSAGLAHGANRLRDHGETRGDGLRPGKIVDADNRNVIGTIEAEFGGGAQHADGHQIVGREDRGRPFVAAQQLKRGFIGGLLTKAGVPHQGGVERKAGREQRFPVALQAISRGADRLRAIDQRDTPMAATDRVRRRLISGAVIVEHHGIVAEPFHGAVDQHDRHFERGEQGRTVHRRGARRRKDEAVDALRTQHSQMGLLALGDLVRIAQDDGEAARGGGKLDGLEQLGKKRIGDVGDDQAQQPAGTLAQTARGSIGCIAELVDRGAYPRQKLGADPGRIVEDVGDGGH